MRLVNRDLALLKVLHFFKCMTIIQITTHLAWHKKLCQRRTRKLCQADYLRKVPVPTTKPGRSPSLFYLGERGALLLGVQSNKPRLTLELTHQMKNTDLMIQIMGEFKNSDIKCEALSEHLIRSLNPEADSYPDGSFILRKRDKNALFVLENCAGTEIIKSPSNNQDIEIKMINYTDMYRSGDIGFYEQYFGLEFNRFRLLYITNNIQRLNSISPIVAEHDKHGFIWLTSMPEILKGISAPIWHIPTTNQFNQSIVG